jgi:hypothetical protein
MSTRTAATTVVAALGALVLALTPVAFARGGGSTGCTRKAPTVAVDNNWQWGSTGSWGLPGQRLTYSVQVVNNDVGCSGSTFSLGVAAPAGYSVSLPTSSISLKSAGSGYLTAYVTSPSNAPDGDAPLSVSLQRAGISGAAATAASTTYYKVYSSDTVAPTLYWPNPGDGTAISGSSYNVVVYAKDDHAVKTVALYLDGTYVTTTSCDDVTYSCTLSYPWSIRGVSGQHTATFEATDWLGNTGSLTVAFTVN